MTSSEIARVRALIAPYRGKVAEVEIRTPVKDKPAGKKSWLPAATIGGIGPVERRRGAPMALLLTRPGRDYHWVYPQVVTGIRWPKGT